jgi:hypothetical protein
MTCVRDQLGESQAGGVTVVALPLREANGRKSAVGLHRHRDRPGGPSGGGFSEERGPLVAKNADFWWPPARTFHGQKRGLGHGHTHLFAPSLRHRYRPQSGSHPQSRPPEASRQVGSAIEAFRTAPPNVSLPIAPDRSGQLRRHDGLRQLRRCSAVLNRPGFDGGSGLFGFLMPHRAETPKTRSQQHLARRATPVLLSIQ